MVKALDGCRVVDLTRVLSGPWCTLMLSDLGAEVVKVEEPGRGDITRQYGPPFVGDESSYFMTYNRGKKSITLNLKEARGKELLQGLVAKADVLVHNYRRDWVYRAGLDYDSLEPLNPRLVYCWLSGYGEDGPYADRGALDQMIMSLSGSMSVTGEADGPPIKSSISYSDFFTGYNAALGIVSALRVRDRTGAGQRVSVNLMDSAIASLGSLAGIYFATGEPPPRVAPDSHPSLGASGAYKTADGYISITAVTDREFPNLCRALGLEHLTEDPEFATNPDRASHRKRLRQTLEPVLATRTTSEWTRVFGDHGVLSEPINDIGQAFDHPQVVHSEMRQTVEHPSVGTVSVMRTPIRLSASPLEIQGPPPRLGEHTREVLESYLGISGEEFDRLREEGVV